MGPTTSQSPTADPVVGPCDRVPFDAPSGLRPCRKCKFWLPFDALRLERDDTRSSKVSPSTRRIGWSISPAGYWNILDWNAVMSNGIVFAGGYKTKSYW